MGRETRILLGLLGLLAGVFVGVLSMKLFVPRPPAGTGPDVHADIAATEPHDLVEPPRFGMRASDFAAAPPFSSAPPLATAAADPHEIPATPPASAGSRFTFESRTPPAVRADEPGESTGPRRDPFVAATSFETPPAADASADAETPPRRSRFAAGAAEPSHQRSVEPSLITPPAALGPMAGAGYVVQEGDSWWSVAERAYGDGRLYRALFAWNRQLSPRVTLAPGTPLEIPSRSRLAVAWPRFMPQD